MFPWCSPKVFWQLTWTEYQVLDQVVTSKLEAGDV